jgi:hypothetical protein
VPLIAEARARAANPLSASWAEAKSLLKVLKSAPDPLDARLQLRTALRRIVESIQLVIVPRGRDRLCAAQFWFAGGKCRSYVILNQPPKANASARTEGGWWCCSLASVGELKVSDLRKRGEARELESLLAGVDLQALTEAMRELQRLQQDKQKR